MSVLVAPPVDEKILTCIDKGLDVFGSSVKTIVYWRFETVYQNGRRNILQRPELFAECLRSFFGERAFSVEAAIVGSIMTTLHPNNVALSDSLTRAITEAKNQLRGVN